MKLSISDLELGDIIRTEGEYAPDWRVLIRASERGADPGMLRFRFQRVLATSGEFVDVAEDAEFPPGTEFDVVYRARVNASPEPEPVLLSQEDIGLLRDVASDIGDHASGDYRSADEIPPYVNVYDEMRSSAGQQYMLSPDSAGWHTLIDGRVIEVSVRFADPEIAHQVRMELDESYALSHVDDEHFETDSGTPPQADLDDEYPACDITGG